MQIPGCPLEGGGHFFIDRIQALQCKFEIRWKAGLSRPYHRLMVKVCRLSDLESKLHLNSGALNVGLKKPGFLNYITELHVFQTYIRNTFSLF